MLIIAVSVPFASTFRGFGVPLECRFLRVCLISLRSNACLSAGKKIKPVTWLILFFKVYLV